MATQRLMKTGLKARVRVYPGGNGCRNLLPIRHRCWPCWPASRRSFICRCESRRWNVWSAAACRRFTRREQAPALPTFIDKSRTKLPSAFLSLTVDNHLVLIYFSSDSLFSGRQNNTQGEEMVIHHHLPRRSSPKCGWRSLLLVAIIAGAADVRAQHLCEQPDIECRPAEAGPWSFWVSIGVSNPGSIFPVATARFATEGEAIAAGSAAVCLPDGDHRLGYTTCSCSVTSVPTVTALAWSFGLESYRGPGSQGIASYLIDYSNLGTCDSSSPWQLAWSVAGERTIACPAGYSPDGHNPPGGCVRRVACPVAALTPVPADDVCAQTLEAYNATPAQKTAACGTLTPPMQTAVNCFANKLSQINNPATGQPIPLRITADIRNIAYQAHLREVWDRMQNLVDETTENPALQTACAARRAEIAAEKGCDNAGPCETCNATTATARRHCLVARPARPNPNDATHVQGNAIDVSRGQTLEPLEVALSQRIPPQSIQGLLNSPTNCNLDWLGAADQVHFQLRP